MPAIQDEAADYEQRVRTSFDRQAAMKTIRG